MVFGVDPRSLRKDPDVVVGEKNEEVLLVTDALRRERLSVIHAEPEAGNQLKGCGTCTRSSLLYFSTLSA